MRKVEDYFDDIPNGLQLSQLTTTRYRRGQISILQRILQDSQVRDSDYKGNSDVKTALLNIYAHCCAFCESRIGKYDDIEHFRPKHAITDVDTEGYYWLAVEWSNLLIACKSCNSDYKGNHFPISGIRLTAPNEIDFTDNIAISEFFRRNHIRSPELQGEQSLLLHPVLDNPDDYLLFNVDGTVTPKNNEDKGRISIQYYGLSDWAKRPLLIKDRQEIIENVRRKVYYSVDSYVTDDRLYQDILDLHLDLIRKIESKKPFSAVRRSCIAHFKAFFIDYFEGEQEIILNRAYERVKNDLL